MLAVAGLTLLGALVLPTAAAAGNRVKSAEGEINHSIHEELEALAHFATGNTSNARSELESSEEDLAVAAGQVEKGVAAGEIGGRSAAEVILDLRDAAYEDFLAEDLHNRLSDKQREQHVRFAIRHKRRALEALKKIETTSTGALVVHEDTPPPPPPLVEDGSTLAGNPEPSLGDIAADEETLNEIQKELEKGGAKKSAAGAISNVTVSGQVVSYTVKGYTVSSNRPGPGGSGEVRLGVEEPQPSGQLKVLSTSNPANLLPHTTGTYTFQIGPPATGFAMAVKQGEVLSLDTPGGNYAVFAAHPAALLESSQGTGLEQNPGALWTLTPHPNVELLMRVVIEPSIPLATLEELEKLLHGALNVEHAATRGGGRHLARKLRSALAALEKATGLVGTAKGEGALSDQSASSIDFYLGEAVADIRESGSAKKHPEPKMFAYGSAVLTQDALSRVQTAKSLARKVP
jgi:hypothetical protein